MIDRTIRGMQRRQQRPDTAADIAERRRRHAVSAQVNAEREARYPVITDANVVEALAWQEARIAELMAASVPPCTNSPACAARGCADCERSYGPQKR